MEQVTLDAFGRDYCNMGFGRLKKSLPLLIFAFFLSFGPDRVEATQIHSGPEGLYAHQFAHLFFVISMAVLMYWLKKMKLIHHRGWRYIFYASLLFALWNLDAMLVHYLDGTEGFATFQKVNGWEGSVKIKTESWLVALIYYTAKLDHLFCVPAIIFWFLGLRALYDDLESIEKVGDRP